MENRSHALIAGIFTIALLVLTTLFAMWLSRDKVERKPFDIVTRFSVTGLNVQAPVRYKGIKVGVVSEINFNPQAPGEMIIRIDVVKDTPITAATSARLGTQGVTGIAFVELDDDGSQPALLTAAEGQVPRIALKPGVLQQLEQRGLAILSQTESISQRLNTLLDPANPQSLNAAVGNIGSAAQAWQKVPERLEPTIQQLPELVDTSRKSLEAFRVFSVNAKVLTGKWNNIADVLQSPTGALARLNNSVDQISDTLTLETLPELQSLSVEARSTLRSLQKTSDTLKDRPQSILFGQPSAPPGPGEAGFIPSTSSQ
jgi:phospholipid/cholesterol/gamma-HCH transport system substrate-binding protein